MCVFTTTVPWQSTICARRTFSLFVSILRFAISIMSSICLWQMGNMTSRITSIHNGKWKCIKAYFCNYDRNVSNLCIVMSEVNPSVYSYCIPVAYMYCIYKVSLQSDLKCITGQFIELKLALKHVSVTVSWPWYHSETQSCIVSPFVNHGGDRCHWQGVVSWPVERTV